MKLTIVGYGTRGDVQPMLTLAWALRKRGHDALLLAPHNMQAWTEGSGVPFAALPVDTQSLFAADPGRHMLARRATLSFFEWLAGVEKGCSAALRRALIDHTAGAEAIICPALMEDRAAAVGAALQIPVLPIYFCPVVPTSSLPSPFLAANDMGAENRLTHDLWLDTLWKSSKDEINDFRGELGVAPAREPFLRVAQREGMPCVLAYSAAIAPVPPDYSPSNHVTGSFTMPAELRRLLGERVPADLVHFLDHGPAPVFIGFGSMPVRDTNAMGATAHEALSRLGVRGVIEAVATDGPYRETGTFILTGRIDHDALFPRCAAAVHHGGSGTIHASLRAGAPTVVCSVFADQPFWGDRCRALGVGDTLKFADITAVNLAEAIERALTDSVRRKAAALGEVLQRTDGLEAAMRVVEEELPGAPAPK